MKRLVMTAPGILLILCASASNAQAADFDFYVLALSWSPDYCAVNGASDPQQCGSGKRLGFVLHGLWPQNNRGYPSNCTPEKLPGAVKTRYQGLYPSEVLFRHEWEKHGTCSGLTPEEYLSLSKRLKESVVIPAEFRTPPQPIRVTAARFKQAILAANANLGDSGLALFCSGSGRFLREVFVCFARDGRPTACSRELHSRAARSCGRPDFLLRNVR